MAARLPGQESNHDVIIEKMHFSIFLQFLDETNKMLDLDLDEGTQFISSKG
jgi:hypothetical protein